jgi:adenylosuccinate lyase
MKLDALTAISPIDGRNRKLLSPLCEYFSEFALIKYRVHVEILYLIELSKIGVVRRFKLKEINFLQTLVEKFDITDANRVKKIEQATNHDVKSVEYWIKEKLAQTTLKDVTEFVHFCLTSADINNLAYSLMITGALKNEYLLVLERLLLKLNNLSKKYKAVPMLARTHGQPASPTTMGKELVVFYHRLQTQIKLLPTLTGKLNGAVGNYNAHQLAFPQINWISFSKKFVKSLGLKPVLHTTQIESHDTLAQLFNVMTRINNILLDLDRDVWSYISLGYFKQKTKIGEVGSSTMPHKVNPINFESSEGNLGLANALFNHMANKLPISRFQRDLSDSTVMRNVGVALGHSILAIDSTYKGLGKLEINKPALVADLNDRPELLGEAIQVVLKREGVAMPYETLKQLTRGKKVSLDDLHVFIDKLEITKKVKLELKQLLPTTYLGLASKLVNLK